MKAFILAAGLGKRLKPLTYKTPKCLLKIKGVPLLDIWLEKLVQAGVKKIYINTNHLSHKIIKHVNKSIYFKKIKIIKEKKLYGTAGSLYRNLKYFSDSKNLIFLHGDNFTEEKISRLIKFHNKNSLKSCMTIMTFRTDYPKECGIITKDSKNNMIAYYEKVKEFRGNIANSAIYILNKKFLTEFKKKHKNSINFSKEVVPHYINRAKVFHSTKKFDDIGTFKNYNKYI